jgi:hypothetical protein
MKRIVRTTFVAGLLPALLTTVACGDESMVDLEDRVSLELFTEIEETPGGSSSYLQRATVRISPSFAESDLDEITRVRIIDQFEREWVLSEDPEFVAGDGGWVLERERPSTGAFGTGPWDLRMVIEEQGVYELGYVQRVGAVGSPDIKEAAIAPDGEGTVRWSAPAPNHGWELVVVERSPSGETELYRLNGVDSGRGGTITTRFDLSASAFEEPNEVVYRLILTNFVSRRTVEDVLPPPPGP